MATVNLIKEVHDDVSDKPSITNLSGKTFQPRKIYARYAKYGDSDWDIMVKASGPLIKKGDVLSESTYPYMLWVPDNDMPDWVREFVDQHTPED